MIMTVDVMSGGVAGPLACVLQEIEGMGDGPGKEQCLNLLATAAEFYGIGHSAGYDEGYEDGLDERRARDGRDDQDQDD